VLLHLFYICIHYSPQVPDIQQFHTMCKFPLSFQVFCSTRNQLTSDNHIDQSSHFQVSNLDILHLVFDPKNFQWGKRGITFIVCLFENLPLPGRYIYVDKPVKIHHW
jgi:hypothetical protein